MKVSWQALVLAEEPVKDVFHGGGPAGELLPAGWAGELLQPRRTLQAEEVARAALHYLGARPQLF